MRQVELRVTRAAASAGRQRSELTVVAVTKFFPLSDVELLATLGAHDFGESRAQELAAKATERPDLTWHFLGLLQTNKAKGVAMRAAMIHSFDREELIAPLAKGVAARLDGDTPPGLLVQVSLDGDPRRGGAPAAAVTRLAELATGAGLDVRGVMAVAPQAMAPARAFSALLDVSLALTAGLPHATVISAGMSGDLEAAVAHGATHLRIGTALLGGRPPLGH